MNDHDLAGKTKNYEFGYIPREEPIPEGWVKTLRPCMGCSSSVTYIDKDKIWHCLKCGWVSVGTAVGDNDNNVWENQDEKEKEMSRVYTEKELQLIIDCIEEGMNVKQIAGKLRRPYQGVWAKVKEVKGMMKEPTVNEPEGDVINNSLEDIPYLADVFYDSSKDELVRRGEEEEEQLKPTEAFKNVDYTRPYPTEDMEKMQKQIDALQIDLIEMETYSRSLEKQVEEANRKLENAEANNKDLDAQAKIYLDEANNYSLRLHKANEQVADLQKQFKLQQEYIQVLEKPVSKIIPSRPNSDTPHARISRALGKAEEAGMRLRNIQVGCDGEALLQFNLVLADSTDKDETELPF